jgi:gas vesicle protein
MRYLIAALGGAAICAGAALLLAPQSGRATRATIRDKATKYSGELQDLAKGKAEHLRNKVRGAKHELASAINMGGDRMDSGAERVIEMTPEAMDDPIYAREAALAA